MVVQCGQSVADHLFKVSESGKETPRGKLIHLLILRMISVPTAKRWQRYPEHLRGAILIGQAITLLNKVSQKFVCSSEMPALTRVVERIGGGQEFANAVFLIAHLDPGP
jgi:hypothetical protein